MRKLLMALAGVVVVSLALGDDRENPGDTLSRRPVRYWFVVEAGGMLGCEHCENTGRVYTFTASTIHGIRIGRRFAVGAGIGYDNYENWKAAPLFGSAAWDLLGKRNKLYVQLNYGYAFASLDDDAKGLGYGGSTGGKAIETLIGYRLVRGKLRVSITGGYKFQRLTSTYTTSVWMLDRWSMPWPSTTYVLQTDMNRLVLKLGIGLN